MKKLLILLIFLLSLASVPGETSIYSFLDNVVEDESYVVVVGYNAPSSDSLAATQIVVGIQNYRAGKSVEAKLASEVTAGDNMILVGHPCNNPLIDLSCKNWPYEEGSMLIKVDNNNLIVSGTTDMDVRNAAKIVAQYRDFPYLKDSDTLLISDISIETPETIPLEKEVKEEAEEEPEAYEASVEALEEAEEESYVEAKEEVLEEDKAFMEPEGKSFTKKVLEWFSAFFRNLFSS